MWIPGIRHVPGRNAYTDTDGTKTGIAIHNTSNTATAAGEAAYAQRRTDGTSAHIYCDATEVIQSLDTSAKAGHAGSSAGNENAVAIEIVGQNHWPRQQWLDRVCWPNLIQVLAVVCRTYGISPRRATVSEMAKNPRVKAIYGHDDMRRAWGGTTHTDPGPNFPWDHLITLLSNELEGITVITDADADKIASKVWSRSWSDYVPLPDGTRPQLTASGALFAARADTRQLITAAAADATRDAALLAAIQAITGNGGPDAAPIVAAIREEADRTRTMVTDLQTALMTAAAENAELRARLATALNPTP